MFIAFEGIEGAGKSTAIKHSAAWLEGLGRSVLLTREPGGSALGRALRALLLETRQEALGPETELFLYLADRAQHVREVIRPALSQGRIVLCDRFALSTLAYQGYGRGLNVDALRALSELASGGLWPDLSLVLDLDPDEGLRRARLRNKEQGLEQTEGRFEAEEAAFHRRVREGYIALSRELPERVALVQATGDAAEVFSRVRALLAPRL